VIFFIIQKSIAAKIITTSFTKKELEKMGKMIYTTTTIILSTIWIIETKGWLDADITGNIGCY
jgi:hypothetical protein